MLPENFLEQGTLYVIDLTVNIDGRVQGLSALAFYANRPPYHGSCNVKPDVGKNSYTSNIVVTCTYIHIHVYIPSIVIVLSAISYVNQACFQC